MSRLFGYFSVSRRSLTSNPSPSHGRLYGVLQEKSMKSSTYGQSSLDPIVCAQPNSHADLPCISLFSCFRPERRTLHFLFAPHRRQPSLLNRSRSRNSLLQDPEGPRIGIVHRATLSCEPIDGLRRSRRLQLSLDFVSVPSTESESNRPRRKRSTLFPFRPCCTTATFPCGLHLADSRDSCNSTSAIRHSL
jgi:hypothetical protein